MLSPIQCSFLAVLSLFLGGFKFSFLVQYFVCVVIPVAACRDLFAMTVIGGSADCSRLFLILHKVASFWPTLFQSLVGSGFTVLLGARSINPQLRIGYPDLNRPISLPLWLYPITPWVRYWVGRWSWMIYLQKALRISFELSYIRKLLCKELQKGLANHHSIPCESQAWGKLPLSQLQVKSLVVSLLRLLLQTPLSLLPS